MVKNTSLNKEINENKKIKDNRLFPFSFIVTIFFIVTSLFLLHQNTLYKMNLYSFMQSQQMEEITATKMITNKDSLTQVDTSLTHSEIDSCTKEGCLFKSKKDDVPEGYGLLEGYYFEYEANDWGTPTTCTGLVVTGGNEMLITHFNEWVTNGNTINKIIDNKLVVNLDFKGLDSDTSSLISRSNETTPVTIGVLRKRPVNMGASTCDSFVEILFAQGK